MQSTPAVVNGVVYVGLMGGYVVALNTATGSLIWRFATNNQIQSSPTVANGIVYVGSYSGYIYALNATNGALIWSYRAGGPTYSSPAIVNGVLYVGANDGNVYALNANNGGLIWIFYAGNIVYSSPAVVNNVVYVCSEDGSVYALGQLTAQRFGRHTSATERPHRRFSRSGQRHSLHRLLRRLRLCFRHFIGTVNDVSSFSIANPTAKPTPAPTAQTTANPTLTPEPTQAPSLVSEIQPTTIPNLGVELNTEEPINWLILGAIIAAAMIALVSLYVVFKRSD